MVSTILNQDNIEKGKAIIADLVARFDSNKSFYTTSKLYKEEEAKVEFINPMMEALGWDVHNKQGLGPNFKEVVFEESLAVGKETRAPDYSFRLGGQLIYYLEAKKPSVNIKDDRSPAYQARRYGWSAKIPIVILTDFEELAIYETTSKPKEHERASTNRVLFYTYEEYVDKWEEIYGLFSKEAVLKELFQKFVDDNTSKTKKGTQSIDEEFLKDIEKWRLLLARNIALRNKDLSLDELNLAVQLIIDRIVFFRMAEDRGIERYQTLYKLSESENIYKQLCEVFKKADLKYNSGLFHFSFTPDYSEFVDNITLHLNIDDGVFKEIFADLYYPKSPYEFSVISPEILGNIYENFLGSIIRLTPSHQAKIEQKPEVKKAGGVFYTPQYIADYIVDKTVGELIKGKSPNQISKLKIVDPACGSGSFLLRAYQKLLDYHLEYYVGLQKPPKEVYYVGKDNVPRLTIREKKRILTNNIYGVDIDVNAVEVTKLSLLLKVLEDENKDVLEQQQKLYQEKVLPNLSYNIKCGNSLIKTDIMNQENLEYDVLLDVNPFNWEHEFPLVFANGGFDAVIGNPPYGYHEIHSDITKNYLKKKYVSSKGSFEHYFLFYELSLSLLKDGGLHGFIVPVTWISIPSALSLRKFILDNYSIVELNWFNYFVFKNAKVNTLISIIKKSSMKKTNVNVFSSPNLLKPVEKRVYPQERFITLDYSINIFEDEKDMKILEKIIKNSFQLKDIAKPCSGYNPYEKGKGKAPHGGVQTKQTVKDKPYHSDIKLGEEWKSEIIGRDLSRYHLEISGNRWIKYGPWLAAPRKPENFNGIRLLVQEITGGEDKRIVAAYYDDELYYSRDVIPIKVDIKEKAFIILGILNSNLITWYHHKRNPKSQKALFPKILVSDLKKIPLSNSINWDNLEGGVEKDIIGFVQKMIELKNFLVVSKTPKEEKLLKIQIKQIDEQINMKVYELYGLTDEEISIIENSFTE
ncbi:MAG: N-6 DNA methylase [Methanobrevibacter sp.]|uniref:Eco57I restriction-modification methylase domain-containing protein n=1 Tax=Methanobrevibacter sp. TaxID=66852 RepID=UPI002E75CA9C|nr:N-6 DNA methylase [Methanobrevibacter sp.]MEE0943326.1 N-6 DNA methylase [Methanobrevibacter sp.]